MELLGTFGIDGKLLFWQLINFAVLLFVLKKFLYSKMLAFLDARTERIERSLATAKSIEEQSRKTQALQTEILTKARTEAQEILAQAKAMGMQEREQLIERTKQDISQLISQAKDQIKSERTQMLQEAKDKFASIVIRAVRAVLTDVSDKEIDAALLKKAIEKL